MTMFSFVISIGISYFRKKFFESCPMRVDNCRYNFKRPFIKCSLSETFPSESKYNMLKVAPCFFNLNIIERTHVSFGCDHIDVKHEIVQ